MEHKGAGIFSSVFIFFQKYAEVELVNLFLVFWGISVMFSIVAAAIYIPTNSAQGLPFVHITSTSYLLFFLIKTILTGVRWNLIVVLLCISLRISHAEHLFTYWLAIQVSSLGKCLFKFSAHFFFNQVIFLMLNCMHILDIHPLLDILLANIFFHSLGSLFVLLIISFAMQKLF